MSQNARTAHAFEVFLRSVLIGAGILLGAIYVVRFEDPPYPAVVPVAVWFLILLQALLLWIASFLGKRKPTLWQYFLTLALAAFGTASVYLAGQVDEQERPFHRKNRTIDE